MIVIADSNKATVTFHDDGHLMQIDKKCALMRISLDAWSDLESAKKALTTREVKWDKWTPQVMCEQVILSSRHEYWMRLRY